MSAQNDGGPAYPVPSLWDPKGMSLRDAMAIATLHGIGTWLPHYNGPLDLSAPGAHAARAAFCYAQADAMLVERDRE